MQRALADHQTDRAHHALPVDAGMLVEIRILGGEESILQQRRYLFDLDRDAPRFAECRDQLAIRTVDTQWHLQAYVAQRFNGRQAWRNQPVRDADACGCEQNSADTQNQAVTKQT